MSQGLIVADRSLAILIGEQGFGAWTTNGGSTKTSGKSDNRELHVMASPTTEQQRGRKEAVVAASPETFDVVEAETGVQQEADDVDIELTSPTPKVILGAPYTKVSAPACTIVGLDDVGKGIRVNAQHEFTIQARTANGELHDAGGDGFFVAIRGTARVRARVSDMDDGTYHVSWKPPLSGKYNIAISLFGVPLNGSPFAVSVHGKDPYALKCEVRGDALTKAVARATSTFEVRYRDKTGGIAQPVELDVFVEPVPELLMPEVPGFSDDESPGQDDMTLFDAEQHDEPTDGEDSPVDLNDSSTATAHSKCVKTTARRVQVKGRPLIVRAEDSLSSEQVGMLLPGQMVNVMEVSWAEGEENTNIRGRVSFVQRRGSHASDDEDDGVALVPVSTSPRVLKSPRGKCARNTQARAQEHLTGRSGRRLEHVGGGYEALDRAGKEKRQQLTERLMTLTSARGSVASADGSQDGQSVVSRAAGSVMVTATGVTTSMGWVTLKKHGESLVSKHWRLSPGKRFSHAAQWKLRAMNDKLRYSVQSEVECDPTAIGFAYGGVNPGWLHSKGTLPEVHKVSYSVGRAGRYLLHVRLHQAGAAVPGSPFELTVRPGHARATATKLPAVDLLKGHVGTGTDDGCEIKFWTHDGIGNPCVEGGAKITVASKSIDTKGTSIESKVTDNADGSYVVRWQSSSTGLFSSDIKLEGEPIGGSPIRVRMVSTVPELSKSELSGDGLKMGVAGSPSTIQVKLMDSFGNPANPKEAFKIHVGVMSELKKKIADAKESPFEGRWIDDESGTYGITYVPTVAGMSEVHVWCDPQSKGERLPFVGSPFLIQVTAGRPTSEQSYVDGYTKESRNQEQQKKRGQEQQQLQVDSSNVVAGDTVSARPFLLDEYGNNTICDPDKLTDELTAKVKSPDDSEKSVPVLFDAAKRKYEVRTETSLSGMHELHVLLHGVPIRGSPVSFETVAASPDPTYSKLLPPATETCIASFEEPTTIEFHTFDRFNNACTRGGLLVTGRLQLVKQIKREGESNQLLMPNNHSVTVEDRGDGTYAVRILIKMMATVRLYVQMDKNLGQAGELGPVLLTFTDPVAEAPASAE